MADVPLLAGIPRIAYRNGLRELADSDVERTLFVALFGKVQGSPRWLLKPQFAIPPSRGENRPLSSFASEEEWHANDGLAFSFSHFREEVSLAVDCTATLASQRDWQ